MSKNSQIWQCLPALLGGAWDQEEINFQRVYNELSYEPVRTLPGLTAKCTLGQGSDSAQTEPMDVDPEPIDIDPTPMDVDPDQMGMEPKPMVSEPIYMKFHSAGTTIIIITLIWFLFSSTLISNMYTKGLGQKVFHGDEVLRFLLQLLSLLHIRQNLTCTVHLYLYATLHFFEYAAWVDSCKLGKKIFVWNAITY